MKINLDAKIETRKFKNGEFEVLVIKLGKNSEKIVFLTSAEMELLRLNSDNVSFLDNMPDLR